MNSLDRQLLLWANGLVGDSTALFQGALLLCGALPLVACVAVLLALSYLPRDIDVGTALRDDAASTA